MKNMGPQGARAGDPFFFSTQRKTCPRTRSAETADATYGRLTRSRAGRRRTQACGTRRSRAGIGARQQPLWVTHTHQAGRRRWRGAARGDKMAGRGAWRQWRHRRLPRFCSDAVPHRLAQCADASFCYRARRAGGVKPACTNAPNGARPRGERKDALDTAALRRCRAQVASIAAAAAASVGVTPQAEAPHSAPVAPRGALRRRFRRRTCTARARAQRHRAAGTSWPELGSPSAAPP